MTSTHSSLHRPPPANRRKQVPYAIRPSSAVVNHSRRPCRCRHAGPALPQHLDETCHAFLNAPSGAHSLSDRSLAAPRPSPHTHTHTHTSGFTSAHAPRPIASLSTLIALLLTVAALGIVHHPLPGFSLRALAQLPAPNVPTAPGVDAAISLFRPLFQPLTGLAVSYESARTNLNSALLSHHATGSVR
jgi:hypothetical protein